MAEERSQNVPGNEKLDVSGWRMFFEWCGVMVVGTVVFTIGRLAIFAATYQPEPNVDWNPWAGLPGMLVLSPIGWAILGLIGPFWLALGGLIGPVKKRQRYYHVLTLLGTLLFGSLWPSTFWGWMGI